MSVVSQKTCWPDCPGMTDSEREILRYADLIQVSFPKISSKIVSPLVVTGKARGNWYFEASFPIVVVNWDGLIIGEGYATAQGDWMTTDFVPFKGTINFVPTECSDGAEYCLRGAVIFKNDNPSGDPALDKAVEIPVIFE